ncbi:MAG: Hsp70 family protein [Planctomycetes bacterium]|nr:Hsp70 family protein [Planctomycetota bacterium]
MSDVIVGIDLGTTNSEVAALVDGSVRVLGDTSRRIMPSAVGVADDGSFLVGESARNQAIAFPERTILSVKRRMGSTETIRLGSHAFSPQEISALILGELKRRAEEALRTTVERAVITVPAYFSDAQRNATREAGRLAGLHVERIINEPTAASLAYGLDRSREGTFLVYDLGGGTFDVSIVRVQRDVTEVLASAGDNHLGGDDFDRELAEMLAAKLPRQVELSANDRARLVRVAEQVKIALSTESYWTVREDHLGSLPNDLASHLHVEVAREEFEERIAPAIDRTLESVHQALKDAGLASDAIDEVILVGGSTRIPLIRQRLLELFDKTPRADLDPDLCVAFGAGVLASRLAGNDVERVLVDVTPYSFGPSFLGIHTEFGHYRYCYRPIIHRNTPLPTSGSEVYYTLYEDQEAVDFHIYQGENEDALQNVLVGNLLIDGLAKGPENSPIVVRMDLDLDGILHVTATERATGQSRKVAIQGAFEEPSEEQLRAGRERIQQLLGYSLDEDDSEAPQDGDAITPSGEDPIERLLRRAQSLRPTMTDDDAAEADELVQRITAARAKGDVPEDLLADLEDLLFYVEEA